MTCPAHINKLASFSLLNLPFVTGVCPNSVHLKVEEVHFFLNLNKSFITTCMTTKCYAKGRKLNFKAPYSMIPFSNYMTFSKR
jgi:hypothetical protein